MKKFLYIISIVLFFSCGKNKIIELPKINHSNISEIFDVSPAYLFYDETKPDSIELNRKNLINTTNWLVNVDKRLSLGQAIPKIVFIKEKKRNSEMHKNENAKNYYTCNNTSIKNLGFIEFTEVVYHQENSEEFIKKNKGSFNQIINIKVQSLDSTYISFMWKDTVFIHTSNQKELFNHIKSNLTSEGNAVIISEFNKNLSFQDYITYKSLLSELTIKNVSIANDEFIFK